MKTIPQALEGIRIIDLTVWQHGPVCTQMLADMGAEVIKIEEPVQGDAGRGVMGSKVTPPADVNYYFELFNRNKKSVAVNLRSPSGKQIIYKLVQNSDVFISNLRFSGLKRLGMDYPTLNTCNPKLIYAVPSGFGPRGPSSDLGSFDAVAQARSGLMSLLGDPGQSPLSAPIGTADQAGAIVMAYGIMLALFVRERTGMGQEVYTSLLGSMLQLEALVFQSCLSSGRNPARVSRKTVVNALWNCYRTKDDRWIQLAMPHTDAYWPAICKVLGIPELENDARFDTHQKRTTDESAATLIELFDTIFSTKPLSEWERLLSDEGIIQGAVYSYTDVAKDPQVIENGYITEFNHPEHGPMKFAGFPVMLSKTPGSMRTPAPDLGQHTEEILLEIGGYTWEEIAQFKEEGAII